MSFGSGDHATMEVSRIDPATDEVAATIPIDATYGHHLYSVGGRLIAETNETRHSTVGSSVLHIIDPVGMKEIASVLLGTYGFVAAGDAGSGLWLADGHGVEELDPATGRVIAAYPDVLNTGTWMAVGGGGVWFASPEEPAIARRLNPSLGDVDVTAQLPTGTTPIAAAISPGAVWILNYEGTLTHVALR